MDGQTDGRTVQTLALRRTSHALWLDQSTAVLRWHRSFASVRPQSHVPNDFSSNESVPGGFELT